MRFLLSGFIYLICGLPLSNLGLIQTTQGCIFCWTWVSWNSSNMKLLLTYLLQANSKLLMSKPSTSPGISSAHRWLHFCPNWLQHGASSFIAQAEVLASIGLGLWSCGLYTTLEWWPNLFFLHYLKTQSRSRRGEEGCEFNDQTPAESLYITTPFDILKFWNPETEQYQRYRSIPFQYTAQT